MSPLGRGIGFAGVLLAAYGVSNCGQAPPNRAEEPGEPLAGQEAGAERPALPPTARPETLSELRRAHAEERSPSDGGGRAWLEFAPGEEPRVRIRERRRWTIVYEAGPFGIAAGGFVRLTVSPFWGWSPPQAERDDDFGFTTAETEAEGVELEASTVPDFWVDFLIGGRPLRPGERIHIVYGAGEALSVADQFAESDSRLWLSVDGDGDGIGGVLVDSPAVRVDPGPAGRVEAFLPSTAEPGERVRLHVSVLDLFGNGPIPIEGKLELASIPEGLEVPGEVELAASDGGRKELEIAAPAPGVFRLRVRFASERESFVTLSNPLLVENGVARILWGDVHGHSNLSDGSATPEEYLAYARDVAALDVVALTDHDHWGMLFLDEHPEIWRSIQEAIERSHAPDRFVTLLGYEWTNWIHGHRHVLYFGDEGPLLSSLSEEYERPDQLWDALRGKPVLTFAHHSAGGPIATNWDFAPDPELEPVTEVASVHGASEAMDAPIRIYSPLAGNFVRDVLDRGYRLGFIGSGDSHDGHPGLVQIASGASGGLAAILAQDLTREGVLGALQARRCYATNGPRIVLRVVLDGRRMGTLVPASEPGKKPALLVRVVGTAPLASIEVVRGGEIVARLDGEKAFELLTTVELDPLRSGEYVYVRVVQEDEGTAWSSPFFVE